MVQREVTLPQILKVMRSPQSSMTEGPYKSARGDWRCTIRGASAGHIIELPLAIKKPSTDSDIFVVTVITA
jgi:hypothetical protein